MLDIKLQVGKSSFEVNLKARRQTWSRALVSRAIPPVKQFDPQHVTSTCCCNFKKGYVLLLPSWINWIGFCGCGSACHCHVGLQ